VMSSIKTKRSWREKLADSKDFPKVAEIDCTKSKRWGEGTFVIPAPLEVDGVMKKVRRGRLTTIDAIRKALAKKHGATIACPITTGIFAWIAAHAAGEAETEGRTRITPYWRTLKSGGELNPKYPGGIQNLRRRLTAEGHRVIKKGNRYFVVEYERALLEPKL
jgi:6-O-methylguanine DNA methyltransferase, DNA binding domain